TALGVTGIVFAALSLVASVFSGCVGGVVMTYSIKTAGWRATAMATTGPATPAPGVGSGTTAAGAADPAGPTGLAAADRAAAVDEPSPPLDNNQANAVVGRVRQLSNNRLKASQSAQIATLLQSPSSSHWIDNTANVAGLTSQVASAIAQSDGSLVVNFTNG